MKTINKVRVVAVQVGRHWSLAREDGGGLLGSGISNRFAHIGGWNLAWVQDKSWAYISGTEEGIWDFARPFLDKAPPMTPEQRKAALVACGWEDE